MSAKYVLSFCFHSILGSKWYFASQMIPWGFHHVSLAFKDMMYNVTTTLNIDLFIIGFNGKTSMDADWLIDFFWNHKQSLNYDAYCPNCNFLKAHFLFFLSTKYVLSFCFHSILGSKWYFASQMIPWGLHHVSFAYKDITLLLLRFPGLFVVVHYDIIMSFVYSYCPQWCKLCPLMHVYWFGRAPLWHHTTNKWHSDIILKKYRFSGTSIEKMCYTACRHWIMPDASQCYIWLSLCAWH